MVKLQGKLLGAERLSLTHGPQLNGEPLGSFLVTQGEKTPGYISRFAHQRIGMPECFHCILVQVSFNVESL